MHTVQSIDEWPAVVSLEHYGPVLAGVHLKPM